MKIPKDLIRYGSAGFISFMVSLLVYWFFSDVLGYAAALVTLTWTPLRFFVRYTINKKWVFKNGKSN